MYPICSIVRLLLIIKRHYNEALYTAQDEFGCKDADWIDIKDLDEEVEIPSDDKMNESRMYEL